MIKKVSSPVIRGCSDASSAALAPRQLPFLALVSIVVSLAAIVVIFGRVPGDEAISKAFWTFDGGWLVDLMLFGDTLGGNLWLFSLLGGALIGLTWFRKWRYASLLAIASSFFVFAPILKESIQRPRPWVDGYQAIINPAGYSFPSGHALGSGLIIGGMTLILFLALRGRPVLQAIAALSGLSLLAIIGASRVYLGAHWTSDVIAGYTLAALFLLVAARIVSRGSRNLAQETVRTDA